MSDIDRVRQMVREGRITAEEAEQLIAVLREVDAADERLAAAGAAVAAIDDGRVTGPEDAAFDTAFDEAFEEEEVRAAAAEELGAAEPGPGAQQAGAVDGEAFAAGAAAGFDRGQVDGSGTRVASQGVAAGVHTAAEGAPGRAPESGGAVPSEAGDRTGPAADGGRAKPVDTSVPSWFDPGAQAAQDVARQAEEMAREAAAAAREMARQAREQARDVQRAAREAARTAAREARAAAREAMRAARDSAREAGKEARRAAYGSGSLAAGEAWSRGGDAHGSTDARHPTGPASAPAAGPAADDAGRSFTAPTAGRAPADVSARPGKEVAPTGTRWVTVEMLGGDLDVVTVPGLTVPTVRGGPGELRIEEVADGYRVRFDPERSSFLGGIFASLRSGEIILSLPPDYGLVIEAAAGDVKLRGVRYLCGRVRAGDVDADRLEGVDFSMTAGDFDAELDLRPGRHVITLGAGDVDVDIVEGSNVTVDGRVSIGEVSTRVPGLQRRGSGLGASVSGVVGTGAAQLDLRVTTGDLLVGTARRS